MATEQTPKPCGGPEHRQFDFWLGEWDVFDPQGELVGRNRIARLFDACALREEWEGVSGSRGTSLNVYAAEAGHWHQTWVDASGGLLLLDGGLRGDTMVLEGTTRGVAHRISWSRIDGDPDQVRQLWKTSADGGTTWETAFDGRYRRR